MQIKYLDKNNQEQTLDIEDHTKESYGEIVINDIIEYIDVPRAFTKNGTIDPQYTNGYNFTNKVWDYFELTEDEQDIIDDAKDHNLIQQYEIHQIIESHDVYPSLADFAQLHKENVPFELRNYIDWERLGIDMIQEMYGYYTDTGYRLRVFVF